MSQAPQIEAVNEQSSNSDSRTIACKTDFDKLLKESSATLQQLQPYIEEIIQNATNSTKYITKKVDPQTFKEVCETLIQNLTFKNKDLETIKSEIKSLFDIFTVVAMEDGTHFGEVNSYKLIEFQKVITKNEQSETVIIGAFYRNKMNGICKVMLSTGSKILCEFKDDLKSGFGVYKYANNDIYNGIFLNDVAHGKVILKYACGNVYEGSFANGVASGDGMFKHANGNIYEGNFENGQPSGRGAFKYANGNTYRGEYLSGLPNGKGIFQYVSGNMYEGDYGSLMARECINAQMVKRTKATFLMVLRIVPLD